MSKKTSEFVLFIKNNEFSYNEGAKRIFARESKKVLRDIAKRLELKEFKIDFNPGGIAVGGDATLIGLWNDGDGIYISMSPESSWNGYQFMYRSVEHMKDWTGGMNQWIPFDSLLNIEETIIKLKQVGGR